MEEHLFSSEELVDLFEGEVLGLGVEEVDEGYEECVEDWEFASVGSSWQGNER